MNDRPAAMHEFDPDDVLALQEPGRLYAPLRASCPVAHSESYGGFWAVTRYHDVQQVMGDPGTFTSSRGIIVPANPASGRRPPLHYDPPEHTLYRRAMNPVFRKDRLRRLDPIVRRLAVEQLPPLDVAAEEGVAVELYGTYCSPFAARVVCALLNVPDELVDELVRHVELFEDAQRRRDLTAVEHENMLLYAMCRTIVTERAAHRLLATDDLVSALLAVEDGTGPVDPEVVVGSLRQIVVAGHGAPALVLASAVAHLAGDPALQEELRSDPSLIPEAVEEMLRLHTPNVGFARTATRDVTIHGRTIAAGEQVAVVLPAANCDPDAFTDPDVVRLGRVEHHIAFGFGPHVCPGSVTGRDEIAAALEVLLARTKSIVLDGEVVYSPWPTSGPIRLPLRLFPRHPYRARTPT